MVRQAGMGVSRDGNAMRASRLDRKTVCYFAGFRIVFHLDGYPADASKHAL